MKFRPPADMAKVFENLVDEIYSPLFYWDGRYQGVYVLFEYGIEPGTFELVAEYHDVTVTWLVRNAEQLEAALERVPEVKALAVSVGD
jgi:hypothetical protein